MATQPEVLEREVESDAGSLSIISRSEIDMQIATAHRFPRSVSKFQGEATSLVTLNEEVASECIYALPRDGKTIEGASARFAEIIAHAWGNCRAGARVMDDVGEFVTSQGVFHDLEKNVAITYEVKRRIVDKNGRRYSADMIGVTANAASSIALRNAILKGIPKAFWSAAYESARQVVMGDFQTLANRRTAALESFTKFGVTSQQVFDKLQIKGEEDITLDHILILRGLLTAIKDGDTTVEAMFAKPVEMPQPKKTEAPKKPEPPAEKREPEPPAAEQDAPQAPEPEKPQPPKAAEPKADEKKSEAPLLTGAQRNIIKAKLKNAKKAMADLEAKFGTLDTIKMLKFNDIDAWITQE